MKTTEFNQQPTAAQLNESMFKKFGSRINFDKYTREQLEDYRNLLRTKIDQTESAAGFNDLLANENYQKDKYMLGVLNTKIKEMLGESIVVEKAVSKAQQKFMGMVHAAQKGEKAASPEVAKVAKGMSKKAAKDYASTKHKGLPQHVKADETMADADEGNAFGQAVSNAKKDGIQKGEKIKVGGKTYSVKEGAIDDLKDKQAADKEAKADKYEFGKEKAKSSVTKVKGKAYGGSKQADDKDDDLDEGKKMAKKAKPDFLDMDKDGNKTEPFKKAVKDKKKVKEGARRAHQYIIIEGLKRFIAEDEEGKAKDITAGTDMVNDFTSWMQRVGQYQTKSMIELADSIRANFGQAEADAFKAAITPALQEALAALTQSRETITRAVAVLAGEEAAQTPMGAETPQTPDLAGDSGLDLPEPAGDDTMNPAGDEFGASDAAAGGEEVSGREMRESRGFVHAKKLAEAHSLISKLAQ